MHCSPTAAPVLVADAAAAAAFPVARLSSDTGKRAKWERGGRTTLCCPCAVAIAVGAPPLRYCCWRQSTAQEAVSMPLRVKVEVDAHEEDELPREKGMVVHSARFRWCCPS